MTSHKTENLNFTDILLPVALILVGGFHEHIACALSVAMSVYLLTRLCRNKRLVIPKSLTALAVGALCLGYLLSCLWAVDPGMAFIGFLKILPVGLYGLCLWQEGQGKVLRILPAFAAVMTVVSAIGMQIPGLESLFSVAGRLAGFFQYPNTFALFLLVCQLLILAKPVRKLWDYLLLAVLVAGLLYSGSRTVFVLFVVSGLVAVFALQKKGRGLVIGIFLGLLAILAAVALLRGQESVLYRYVTISLQESTFLGRLLYMQDALKLLIRYPFGMGYMGYYYSQSAIQTGLYAVAYVHNDFLQFFLDAGWIPGLLLMAVVGKHLLRKDIPLLQKLPVAVLGLHSLMDFSLQYTAMLLLLVLLVDTPAEKTIVLKKGLPVWKAAVVALGVLSLYMGLHLGLAHFRQYPAAEKLYPFNTQVKLSVLEQTQDLEEANALAEQILAQNESLYLPYSIKAKYAYSQGDILSLIQYKNQVFRLFPFGYEEYEEYCVMLINSIVMYQKMGDSYSAQVCREELRNAKVLLEAGEERLSFLGKRIVDQPVTSLSEDVNYYIDHMG